MNILLISDFTKEMNSLFTHLQEFSSAKIIGYDFQNIKNVIDSEDFDIVLVMVHNLTYEQSHSLSLLLQYKPQLKYFMIGNKDECKDYYGKFKANIVKYILLPIQVSGIIKQTKEYLKIGDEKIGSEVDDRKKILIVDDDVFLLRSMMDFLKKNYRVSVAKSGMTAFGLLEKEIPDLILLDYEMPVCNGLQTLQMIRGESKYHNIPVFFLTGVSDPAMVKEALSLKPEGYILKTSGRDAILSRVNDFFSKAGK